MQESTQPHYTLITGGSKGIGRAFADVCASQGRNLILVALHGENLEAVSVEIAQKTKVDVRFLELNLAHEDSAKVIHDFCTQEGLTVDFIINNAGFGTVGKLLDSDLDQHLTMIKVNMVAPYTLIRLFLPTLEKLDGAGILNVSSQAGLLPVPYKGTYSATKAFMYYISLALAYEQKESKVHIGCLLPNGVPTNPAVQKRIQSLGFVGRLVTMDPHAVAEYAMKSMRKKKRIIIPGWVNRVANAVSLVTPLSFNMHVAATQVKKNLKNAQ